MGLLKVTGEQFKQTIVMITHDEEIAQMADRIVRIEDGRIVSGNAVDENNTDEKLENIKIVGGAND